MKYISLFIAVLLFVCIAERVFLPDTTEQMRTDAIAYGAASGKEAPPQVFRYDGCTLFPDRLPGIDLREGCLEHDYAYYHGGTQAERKEADVRLKEHVASEGIFGQIMQFPVYIGVRVFGDTFLTKLFDAHWGFGHD